MCVCVVCVCCACVCVVCVTYVCVYMLCVHACVSFLCTIVCVHIMIKVLNQFSTDKGELYLPLKATHTYIHLKSKHNYTITLFLSRATNRYPAKVNNHDLIRAAPDPITNRMTNKITSRFILSIGQTNKSTILIRPLQ